MIEVAIFVKMALLCQHPAEQEDEGAGLRRWLLQRLQLNVGCQLLGVHRRQTALMAAPHVQAAKRRGLSGCVTLQGEKNRNVQCVN